MGKARIGILVFFFSLFLVQGVEGQVVTKSQLPKKEAKKYSKVQKLNREKKYQKAIKELDKILKKEPRFVDGYLTKSGILYNLKAYAKSIEALNKAIAVDSNYNAEIYFSKATIHRELKDYSGAMSSYKSYIDRAVDSKRKEKAVLYYEQAKFRLYSHSHPVSFVASPIAGDINTDMNEYIPAMTLDGTHMMFTRRVGSQEDLYTAEYIDGEYKNVKAIEELNTAQNEGVHTITGNGERIIFTACHRQREGMGSCDLYTSRKTVDGWSPALNMGSVINSISWEAQPSVSSDGKTLYWSSNRKHGHGGNDIWYSTRTDTTGWNQPKPLSSAVNTPYDEESPFIHPDGKTLYFRSNRPIGMGDFDIYYSRFDDSTKMWSPSKNIGYPINTEYSEGALSVSLDGSRAYFATDRHEDNTNQAANLDIYSFELYEEARPQPTTFVKALVLDKKTNLPLKSKLEIVNLSNKQDVTKVITSADGSYLGSLVSGHEYAFYAESPGYVYHSEHFDLMEERTSYDPYRLVIELEKVTPSPDPVKKVEEESSEIILHNVFFDTGSAVLKENSITEINKLKELLDKNPDVRIEIAGHTDNVGSSEANLALSQKRADAVVTELLNRGVSRTRLVAKGYGESNPIDTNDTESGRQNNRRTTFKIL